MTQTEPLPQTPIPRSNRGPTRRGLTLKLIPGWPLLAVFWGYPVFWLLGIQVGMWVLAAFLLGLMMWGRRSPLVVPRGFGLWLLFIGWTFVSAFALSEPGRLAAWGYREFFYLSATVILVYLVNVDEKTLPTRRIALALYALWVATVFGGVLGVLFPSVVFPSLAKMLLPGGFFSDPFIQAMVTPRLGSASDYLNTIRPSALYAYTNEWGAAMGILTPLALFARRYLKGLWARRLFWVTAAASVYPIVMSVNRGLWLSLGIVVAVIAGRALLRLRVVHLIGIGVSAAIVLAAVLLSPLNQTIQSRLDTPNTDTRENLMNQALNLTMESPLVGYGAPVSGEGMGDTNDVSIGTHGQLWTVMVSHGFPGALFYVAFFVVMLAQTWRIHPRAWWVWASIIVFVSQMLFYNALPVPIMLAMVSVALLLREARLSAQVAAATGRRPQDSASLLPQRFRARGGEVPA